MCSINGYIGTMLGDSRPFKILTKGLSLLNYRGYDSKGLAIITDFHRDGPRLEIEKMVNDDVNNIRDIYLSENKHHDRFMHVGIAHNRWATHGDVTIENAHPHTDCGDEIAVVHNGIIDNYKELYEKYPGHTIRSETDTEIIPHLIEEYIKRGLDFEDAFKSAVDELEGSYAIAAIYAKETDILMVARKDSPLIIGVGDYENFVSSDIMSLLEFTDRFIRLEDGDVAKIGKYSVGEGTIEIYNEGEIVEREIKKIDEIPQAWFENTQYHLVTEDGELWPDITLNEMGQQRETMISALDQDKENISKIIEMLKSAEKIILTGAGSSYNAAIGGEFLFCELGYDARAISACDLERYEKIIDEKTAVIALSQSGETMDIIQPLKKIKSEKNPKIISMVNVPFSTISEEIADLNIPLNCGAERAVAATKSFTSQQILLRYLYYGLDGRLDDGENIIKTAIEKIPHYRYDSPFQDYDDLTTYLSQTDQIILLGEGINYSVAREAALKFEEITNISAKAFECGEFKHGPLTMIVDRGDQFDKKKIVIAIAPHDNTYSSTQNIIQQIRAHGGRVIELTNFDDEQLDKEQKIQLITADSEYYLKMPNLEIYENAEIMALQYLIHNTADFMNIISDKPIGYKRRGPWDKPNGIAKICSTK